MKVLLAFLTCFESLFSNMTKLYVGISVISQSICFLFTYSTVKIHFYPYRYALNKWTRLG